MDAIEEKAERERFEAYIRKDCGDLSTFGNGENVHYRNSSVNHEWVGWLACLAAHRTASAEAQGEALCGWRLDAAYQAIDSDGDIIAGVWELGSRDDDGNFYAVATVDTGNYDQPEAAEPLARAILARLASPASASTASQARGGESMYLVIVPESKLDDAYLLTQWFNLESIDAEVRADTLEHFHEDDNWTHTDVTGSGDRLEFSLSLEDGWIKVLRLFGVEALCDVSTATEPAAWISASELEKLKAGSAAFVTPGRGDGDSPLYGA